MPLCKGVNIKPINLIAERSVHTTSIEGRIIADPVDVKYTVNGLPIEKEVYETILGLVIEMNNFVETIRAIAKSCSLTGSMPVVTAKRRS